MIAAARTPEIAAGIASLGEDQMSIRMTGIVRIGTWTARRGTAAIRRIFTGSTHQGQRQRSLPLEFLRRGLIMATQRVSLTGYLKMSYEVSKGTNKT